MRLHIAVKATAMAILLSAVTAIELAQPAAAIPTEGTLIAKARRRLNFRVGARPSRYRVGGFSRSGAGCSKDQQPAALVPPASQEGTDKSKAAVAVDKTAVERPTFFVYMPAIAAKSAQFTLQDESGKQQLHSVEFQLTGKAGIVGITLPPSAPSLQVGQKYFWQVAVACDPDEPSDVTVVSSWVERVQVATAASGDRLTVLAEQGVWQDVLTQLALQRYQAPADQAIAEDWSSLMEDAGLTQYKQAQVIQIVKN